MTDARIVDGEVQSTELLHHGVDHRFYVIFARDIDVQEGGSSSSVSNFLHHALPSRIINVGDYDRCSLCSDALGHCLADSRPCTGDETRPAIHESHLCPFLVYFCDCAASTRTISPEMNDASSERRNAMTFAISSGSAGRPPGCSCEYISCASCG